MYGVATAFIKDKCYLMLMTKLVYHVILSLSATR